MGFLGSITALIQFCTCIYIIICVCLCLFSLCNTTGIKFYKEQKEFQRLQANYWLVQSFTLRVSLYSHWKEGPYVLFPLHLLCWHHRMYCSLVRAGQGMVLSKANPTRKGIFQLDCFPDSSCRGDVWALVLAPGKHKGGTAFSRQRCRLVLIWALNNLPTHSNLVLQFPLSLSRFTAVLLPYTWDFQTCWLLTHPILFAHLFLLRLIILFPQWTVASKETKAGPKVVKDGTKAL